jgi:prefoldin subunit 5
MADFYKEVFEDDVIRAWEEYLSANGAASSFAKFLDAKRGELSEVSEMMNAELQRLKEHEQSCKAKYQKLAAEYE